MQPADLAGLDVQQACVLVFTGAEQKVGISLIEAVQALGEHGRFIRISGNGRNALDFHIAYYLGQWMVRDPQATFLIVSKDTGYDPLITHLNATGSRVKRISVTPDSSTKTAPKKVAQPTAKKAAKQAPAMQPAKIQAVSKKAAKKSTSATNKPQSDADKIIKGLKKMLKNLPGSEASLRRMASTWLVSTDIPRMDSAIAELSRRRVIDLTEPKIRYVLPN